MSDVCLYELVPVPCGHTHNHLSEILACIESNGDPGFMAIGINVKRRP